MERILRCAQCEFRTKDKEKMRRHLRERHEAPATEQHHYEDDSCPSFLAGLVIGEALAAPDPDPGFDPGGGGFDGGGASGSW